MATYVFVHGAWMGAFAWEKLLPLMRAAGHRAIAVELPAHGDDPTPAHSVSLEAYRDAVIAALPDNNSIVVGHSLAGMVISAVAEAVPQRVRHLVYVAAYLPQDGQSLYQLAQTDAASKVGQYWHQDDPAHYSPATIRAEGIPEVFAADCSAEDQAMLVARHKPEPLGPMAAPVTLTADRFGSVPKLYVMTNRDQCVSPDLQRRMLESAGPAIRTVTVDTGHCPFLSRPEVLASLLLEAAG